METEKKYKMLLELARKGDLPDGAMTAEQLDRYVAVTALKGNYDNRRTTNPRTSNSNPNSMEDKGRER